MAQFSSAGLQACRVSSAIENSRATEGTTCLNSAAPRIESEVENPNKNQDSTHPRFKKGKNQPLKIRSGAEPAEGATCQLSVTSKTNSKGGTPNKHWISTCS
ncbi:hypothetical protein KI387_002739, partial [Taxus chinensis]